VGTLNKHIEVPRPIVMRINLSIARVELLALGVLARFKHKLLRRLSFLAPIIGGGEGLDRLGVQAGIVLNAVVRVL